MYCICYSNIFISNVLMLNHFSCAVSFMVEYLYACTCIIFHIYFRVFSNDAHGRMERGKRYTAHTYTSMNKHV